MFKALSAYTNMTNNPARNITENQLYSNHKPKHCVTLSVHSYSCQQQRYNKSTPKMLPQLSACTHACPHIPHTDTSVTEMEKEEGKT